MMSTDPRPLILATLRGAPLSIVVCLLLYPDRSLGAKELARLTHWHRNSIADGLAVLGELGWAQQHARYQGWMLTTHARQMLLGESPETGGCFFGPPEAENRPREAENRPPEAEILSLPHVVVVSNTLDPDLSKTTTNYQLPHEACKNSLAPPDGPWGELLACLQDECGVYPAAARRTVEQARATGRTPEHLAALALAWRDYCGTDRAANVKNPVALIAARVASGTPPPLWSPQAAQSAAPASREDQVRARYGATAEYVNY